MARLPVPGKASGMHLHPLEVDAALMDGYEAVGYTPATADGLGTTAVTGDFAALSPSRSAASADSPLGSYVLSHPADALQRTEVAYGYTVASVRVADLGSQAPAQRYAALLSASAAPPAGAAASQPLFLPGEVEFYARQAAARGEALTDAAVTTLRAGVLRRDIDDAAAGTPGSSGGEGGTRGAGAVAMVLSPAAARGSTNPMPGGARGAPSPATLAASMATVPAPLDAALAALHRSELARAVAHRAVGGGGEARGSTGTGTGVVTRTSSAPRFRTAERAERRQARDQLGGAVSQYADTAAAASPSRRASLSTLHALEALMAQADAGASPLPAAYLAATASPGRVDPSTAATALRRSAGSPGAMRSRAALSPIVTTLPASGDSGGRMVKLPDGRYVSLASLRSPLAGDVAAGWRDKLRDAGSSRAAAAGASGTPGSGSRGGGVPRALTASAPRATATPPAPVPAPAPARPRTPATTGSRAAPATSGTRTSWLAQLDAATSGGRTSTGSHATPAAPPASVAAALPPPSPATMAGANGASEAAVRTLTSTKSFRGMVSPPAASLVPPHSLPEWATAVAAWDPAT